jgi:D-tyrosyl-tRNA(Tyr) deacylase
MKAVIQRVTESAVSIDGTEKCRIGPGILILLGIETRDTPEDGLWLARKISQLRIFEDADGKMNRSLIDVGGESLVVSQFTLLARVKKGTRPSFDRAAKPAQAIPLYEAFVAALETETGKAPGTGEFGAMMQVSLVNDGPVTILIDTQNRE